MQKVFVIKKRVLASSVKDAIKKERGHVVDSCWVDEEWLAKQENQGSNFVHGFKK